MELTYLLTWIGAVGLVTLATYACFCLLKHGQRLGACRKEVRTDVQGIGFIDRDGEFVG